MLLEVQHLITDLSMEIRTAGQSFHAPCNLHETGKKRPPLRIAILECDKPLEQTRKKYGSYGRVFTALLKAGADALKQPDVISSTMGLEMSTWDVEDSTEYPKHKDIDAVLVTGSRHNSFDSTPWILRLVDYIRNLLTEQSRVRVIGVCFGHQIVGRALGARVDRNHLGWETSVSSVNLTDSGARLFGKEGLSLHQMHRDIVCEYPDGVENLGSSPRCEVQGMYEKGRLLTVQGHPELNEQIMRELLESRHRLGILDDEIFEAAMKRVGNQHDGVLVAQAFLRFLMED